MLGTTKPLPLLHAASQQTTCCHQIDIVNRPPTPLLELRAPPTQPPNQCQEHTHWHILASICCYSVSFQSNEVCVRAAT